MSGEERVAYGLKFHLDRPIIHFNDYQEHCKNLAAVDFILVLCIEV